MTKKPKKFKHVGWTKKIAGFIAWHPNAGIIYSSFSDMSEIVEYEHVTKRDQEQGWRIRPCKIVFTDKKEVYPQEIWDREYKADWVPTLKKGKDI